ncbi:hypothetical protein GCM10009795_044080 [Nocardioides hankookensis]
MIDHGPVDPSHHHGMATHPPTSTVLVPVYFVGDTSAGEARLFREFDDVPGDDRLQAALDRVQQPPSDPDYRTIWQPGSFDSAARTDGAIEVELGSAGLPAPDGPAAQQLVYTLQGAVGERLPVQLLDDGAPVGEPYQAAPESAMLSPVSISDPAEGNEYEGSISARGRARTGLRSLAWHIFEGPTAVTSVAEGAVDIDRGGGTFSPWSADVDLTGLAPGTYIFSVSNPDHGYASTFTDTRTIVVR